jgi:hypothetical protein
MAAILALGSVAFAAGCSGATSTASNSPATDGTTAEELSATIGPAGGELTGAKGSAFEGVHVVIPAGALAADTEIKITPATDGTPLPATAVRCGPMFSIAPAGLALAAPASVTLPFDESVIQANDRFDDEVKVWVRAGDHWTRSLQTDSAEGSVTFDLPALTNVAAGVNPPKEEDVVHFHLVPNPKFAKCLAQYPDDPKRAPSADVTVVRGDLNDSLRLRAKYIKPGLKFDLFTVEHSSLKADGTPDPSFVNFGLAWYQSDVDAHDDGQAQATIRTILLDQIFGFDPAASLPPTGTFNVGFWFNNPQDAVACGFNAAAPTPFNGEHDAGPLAMISVPDATTGLGPLCTKPDTSVSPARCSP